MEGDTVLLQDIFHRVDTAEGMGRLVPTGLRPKILDELALNGVEVPPHIFRNEGEALLGSARSGGGRHHRPARPGPGRGAAIGGALRDAGAPPRREVSRTMLAALQLRRHRSRPSWPPSSSAPDWPWPSWPPSCGCARSSARWPRSSTTPWARPRCRSRSSASRPSTASSRRSPSASPGIFGRIDTTGALEQRLERAAIPLRSGEYIVISRRHRAHAGGGRRRARQVAVSARSSRSSWSPASPGTCRHAGPPSGSSRCRSSCPTRWRSWRRRSRAARRSSAPSTCTAATPGRRCRPSWTG